MKTILSVAAIAATMLTGSVASSQASTFSYTGPLDATTYTDVFTFSGTAGEDISATITKSTSDLDITAFDLLLGTTSVATGSLTSFGSTTFGGISDYTLTGTGTYTLALKGSGSGEADGTFTSPVPLPSTVALFGVAVAGLGVAGAMRKKSASTAA